MYSFILLSTPFFTPHNPLIRSFLILSIHLTPNTPLRLYIRTHCTLDLYLLFQTIVSLLYINIGNNIPSCKTLAHSRLSLFTSTKDLIAPATFLLFTTFLLHSASVSYTHLRAHETPEHLVCRLLLEKKK